MVALAAHDLVGLVALARNQYDVTLVREHHRRAYGLRAVRNAQTARPGRNALHDLVEDRFRVLRAGVVRREDRHRRLPRGYGPHLGALRTVAVAAAAAHHDELLLGTAYLVDGLDDVLQGVGRMRIVDYNRTSRCRAYGLETAAHRVQGTQAPQSIVLAHTQQPRRTIDGQQVGRVEAADEVDPHLAAADREQHAVEVHLQHLAAEVGHRPQGVGRHTRTRVLHHHRAVAVVGIDQREGLARQRVEEPFLRLDILGEGLMVVEVVVREVGEYGPSEAQPPHTLLHDRVRRHLHEAILTPVVDHLSHHGVQTHGVGRSVRGRNLPLADAVDHCRDKARLVSQHAEHVAQQRGDGRLAVRARNTHQTEFMRWVVVECRRHVGQSAVAVIHDGVAHALGRMFGQALAHNGRSPRLDGRIDEVVAVAALAAHGKETVSTAHTPRVVTQGPDLGIGRRYDRPHRRGRQKFAKTFHISSLLFVFPLQMSLLHAVSDHFTNRLAPCHLQLDLHRPTTANAALSSPFVRPVCGRPHGCSAYARAPSPSCAP